MTLSALWAPLHVNLCLILCHLRLPQPALDVVESVVTSVEEVFSVTLSLFCHFTVSLPPNSDTLGRGAGLWDAMVVETPSLQKSPCGG